MSSFTEALKDALDKLELKFDKKDLEKGLKESLLHDFYKRHPGIFPYNSILSILKALEWPQTSKIEEMADYPSGSETGWSESCQGLASDGENWYITQENALWKIPSDDPMKGAFKLEMPDWLKLRGYYHLGDLDYFDGYLYVPIEGKREEDGDEYGIVGKIALYDAKPPVPVYIGSGEVFNKDSPHEDIKFEKDITETQLSTPWCAVNPLNKYLYTSFYDSDHLLVYERAIIGNTTEGVVGLELTYKGKFPLFDKDGESFFIKGIQGGVFSQNGHLYLVSHNHNFPKSGLYGFDMITGRNVSHLQVKYDPNQDDGEEELEGIDIWDLDAKVEDKIHKVKGQIHIIMVDVSPNIPLFPPGIDDVYIKHYRVASEDKDKI